jgi:type II secretory pathway component PulF
MEAQSQQEVIDFIITRLVTWVPTVWIGVVVVDHLLRMLLREPWMAGVRHTILMYLPGFVAWTRTKFYANALLVMHELVRGGVNFQEGFAKAAEAVSPSPLEKQFKAGEAQLRQGRPLQEAVKELKSLPFTARSSMLTAAQVGRQEQSLQSLHEQYAQEMRDSPRRVLLAVIGYHVLVFGTITMVIVVTGGLNYAAALDQLMQP